MFEPSQRLQVALTWVDDYLRQRGFDLRNRRFSYENEEWAVVLLHPDTDRYQHFDVCFQDDSLRDRTEEQQRCRLASQIEFALAAPDMNDEETLEWVRTH